MSTHPVPHRPFVPDEDVTVARRPTPDQARAIHLLELNPSGAPVVRLSWAQWRHVNRVVGALAALGVPPPRAAADDCCEAHRTDTKETRDAR